MTQFLWRTQGSDCFTRTVIQEAHHSAWYIWLHKLQRMSKVWDHYMFIKGENKMQCVCKVYLAGLPTLTHSAWDLHNSISHAEVSIPSVKCLKDEFVYRSTCWATRDRLVLPPHINSQVKISCNLVRARMRDVELLTAARARRQRGKRARAPMSLSRASQTNCGNSSYA